VIEKQPSTTKEITNTLETLHKHSQASPFSQTAFGIGI